MNFAVIKADGRTILQYGEAPESEVPFQGGELLSLPCGPEVTDATHYWDGEAFQLYPPKPEGAEAQVGGLRFDFDLGEWVPTRSTEARLADARSSTTISRVKFLMGCVQGGVLPQSDALAGAKGDIPPSMEPLIATLPEAEAFEMRLRWAALTEIDRLDPFITALAAMLELPDEAVDMIFGI